MRMDSDMDTAFDDLFPTDLHLHTHPLLWTLDAALKGSDRALVCLFLSNRLRSSALLPLTRQSSPSFQDVQGQEQQNTQTICFTRDQHKALANNLIQQRRQLPPAINERAFFTKASPFGDPKDPYYHSPCHKIASYFSPDAACAASVLFEDHSPRQCSARQHGRLGSPRKKCKLPVSHPYFKHNTCAALVWFISMVTFNAFFPNDRQVAFRGCLPTHNTQLLSGHIVAIGANAIRT